MMSIFIYDQKFDLIFCQLFILILYGIFKTTIRHIFSSVIFYFLWRIFYVNYKLHFISFNFQDMKKVDFQEKKLVYISGRKLRVVQIRGMH